MCVVCVYIKSFIVCMHVYESTFAWCTFVCEWLLCTYMCKSKGNFKAKLSLSTMSSGTNSGFQASMAKCL